MKYWLVKSEPFKYSWDNLMADGETSWEGVRNYAARNNLAAMKKGDQLFFYHSNEGLDIVGIAQVSKEAYPDPGTDDNRWVMINIKPVKRLKNSVSLRRVKSEPGLANMALLRLSRLSVQPVTEEEWKIVLRLSQSKEATTP